VTPNERGALQRFRVARNEEVVAHAVVAALSGEGRVVTRLDRIPQTSGRSPDFLAETDGRDIAIEIVRYLSPSDHQAAMARVILVEAAVRERLGTDAKRIGKTIAVSLSHSVEGLAGHRRQDVGRDADAIASAVRSALAGPADPLGDRPLASTVPWVEHAHVGLVESHDPSSYFLKSGSEPDPDTFVHQVVGAKADQHLGFADTAILVVNAMFDDYAEDLADAFGRYEGQLPWWRVYVVRHDAKLVYEAVGKDG
jgi:hypothetical protein